MTRKAQLLEKFAQQHNDKDDSQINSNDNHQYTDRDSELAKVSETKHQVTDVILTNQKSDMQVKMEKYGVMEAERDERQMREALAKIERVERTLELMERVKVLKEEKI